MGLTKFNQYMNAGKRVEVVVFRFRIQNDSSFMKKKKKKKDR